jgi:hypothetical protein
MLLTFQRNLLLSLSWSKWEGQERVQIKRAHSSSAPQEGKKRPVPSMGQKEWRADKNVLLYCSSLLTVPIAPVAPSPYWGSDRSLLILPDSLLLPTHFDNEDGSRNFLWNISNTATQCKTPKSWLTVTTKLYQDSTPVGCDILDCYPWRWKKHDISKHWESLTQQHSFTPQMTSIPCNTAQNS